MLKRFRQFFESTDKSVVFAFGRFNPISIGHQKLIELVNKTAIANNAEGMIFASHTEDNKKNPLDYNDKIKFLRILTDKTSSTKIVASKINNPFEAVEELAKQGYKKIILVAGSDRVSEYKRAEKYALENGATSFDVISAGDRDPDADDVTGISASKLRQFVIDNDEQSFIKNVPFENKDANLLFKFTKAGLSGLRP